MTTLASTTCPALECVIDIARIIGAHRLSSDEDSRSEWTTMVEWADEFQAMYEVNPDACETYNEDIDAFALAKACAAGWTAPTPETYLLVWNTRKDGKFQDHWRAHESRQDAQQDYINLCESDDLYSASICVPIESTDYSKGR